MAREIIFKVGTQEAVKNVADLQNNIKLLKDQLKDSTKSFEENQQAVKALRENQAALRQAMYDTGVEFSEVQKAAIGVNAALEENSKEVNIDAASYNELVRSMDILKQQWRATTDETTRAELGEKINQVNNRLKQMDASVGNYQRNVGMYSNVVSQLGNSLSSIAPAAGKVVGGIKQVDAGLKLLSTNPIVGVLTILVPLIQSVTSALKSSEENANATAKAFSTFAAVGDFLKVVFQTLGKAIANVIQNFAVLLGDIFPTLQQYAENRIATTQEEIDLEHRRRIVLMQNADEQKRIAEWENKAADSYTYTAKERLEFLQKANDAQERIAQRNMELAEMEYKVQENLTRMAGNKKEENDKLAQTYANMVQAETAYYQTTKRNVSKMASARKEMAAEAEAARKKIEEARRAEIEALDAIGKEIDDIIANQGEELLEQMDKDNEKARDKVAQRLEIIQQGIETRQQWNEILTENEREQEEKRYQIALAGNQRIIEALQDAYTEAMQNGDLEAALDYEQQIADKKVEIEMDAARRIKEVNKQAVEDAKEAMKARVEVLNDAMGATASIFDSLADIYDSNTKKTKAEAERVKNLRIAAATIDMLQGVVTAISSAQELGPIAGPIMAAINSAAVIAAGVANINKIKSTQISTSGGTSAVATPPTFQPPVTQVRNLTTSTEEDRLNQMASSQRVYILSSDLEADSHSRRARVTDTTF